jgi:Predicted ATPase
MTTHVITGGPSVGKTTTLKALSARGLTTMPEAARLYWDQKESEGYTAEQTREQFDFQRHIEDRRIEMHRRIPDKPEQDIFLDRSIVDTIAYRRFYGTDNPERIKELTRYVKDHSTVFILERLPFDDDGVRREDEQEAEEVHNCIRETYEALGYEIIPVPVKPIEGRADYILNRVSPREILEQQPQQ